MKKCTLSETAEIIPYKNEEHSYLDRFFPFKDHHLIKDNANKIVEIEALSILPQYRRENNLERILFTLLEHLRLNNIALAMGIINPALYLALRNTYKLPVKKLGKRIEYSSHSLFPYMIAAEYVYKNISQYPWLYKLYESDKNLARKIIYNKPSNSNMKERANI